MQRRSFGKVRFVVTLLMVVLATASIAGQQWYEHYEAGIDLEQQGRWPDALEEFRAAAAVEREPRAHILTYGRNFISNYDPGFHMARCLAELGRPGLAAEHLARAIAAGVTPRPEIEQVQRRIREVAAQRVAPAQTAPTPVAVQPATGQLVVEVDPPTVKGRVWVDGTLRGTTPFGPVPLSVGVHLVRVEAAGFVPEEREVTTIAGVEFLLHLNVQPLAPPTPVTQLPIARETAVPAHSQPQRTSLPRSAQTAPLVVGATPPTAVPAAVEKVTPDLRPPAPTPVVKAIEFGERRSFPLSVVIAIVVVAVALVVAFVTSRRKRATSSPVITAATRALDGGATVFVDAGNTVGSYSVVGTLGRGGMATTYQARRQRDGAIVALKIPHESCLSDPSYVARFLREGKLGEQLHHPRIVRIFEAGEEKGRPFLAMELIAGHTLKEEIRQHGPLGVQRVLELARDVAEALDYAHAKGVIHRDLKPDNVMLLPDGTLKVMDFGIARLAGQSGLTTTNIFMGTPLYAAPEMVDAKSIDHRADLYALGIMMFEMLEGTVPFSADSPFRVLEMHMRQPLPNRAELAHQIPEAVWRIVARLCAKDPAERYPTAESLLVELNRLLHDFSKIDGADVF